MILTFRDFIKIIFFKIFFFEFIRNDRYIRNRNVKKYIKRIKRIILKLT